MLAAGLAPDGVEKPLRLAPRRELVVSNADILEEMRVTNSLLRRLVLGMELTLKQEIPDPEG